MEEHFHMFQFAGSRGPFKGWSEQQRRDLMQDLLAAILHRRLEAYGACLRVGDFRRLTPRHQSGFIGPYMVNFYEMVLGLGLAASDSLMPLHCVYSLQDDFAPMMRRWWREAKATKRYGPRLGRLFFMDMRTTPDATVGQVQEVGAG